MAYDFEQVSELYEAGLTKRWHTRNNVTQTLQEHIAGMMIILVTLHPNPSAALLKAVARHDLSESYYGDIPSQAKADNPELHELEKKIERTWWAARGVDIYEGLTSEDLLWIELCDSWEPFLFLSNQPFLTPDLNDIRMKCAERAKDIILKLSAFGHFLDPEETMN